MVGVASLPEPGKALGCVLGEVPFYSQGSLMEVSRSPSRAVPLKTGLSSLQREQAWFLR